VDRATADSNIYVSVLKFGGKPLTLLEKAIEEDIELAISDSILRETLGVLRDKFHRTDEELLADELYISACTKRIQPNRDAHRGSQGSGRQSRRRMCRRRAFRGIVTGDTHLLSLRSFRGIEIMRVSEFLAQRERRGRSE
jgi:predicted nucleic acid-binding protein